MQVLKKARQVIYKFIWDEGSGIGWGRGMILTKKEGDLNIWDTIFLAKSMTIKLVARLWSDDNVSSTWMKCRYVGNRSLTEILPRPKDSPSWLSILRLRPAMNSCVRFEQNFNVIYEVPDFKTSISKCTTYSNH